MNTISPPTKRRDKQNNENLVVELSSIEQSHPLHITIYNPNSQIFGAAIVVLGEREW